MDEVRRIKDAEIEKYKKYLNKAKKIIEGFGEGKSRAAEDSLEVLMQYYSDVALCTICACFFLDSELEESVER